MSEEKNTKKEVSIETDDNKTKTTSGSVVEVAENTKNDESDDKGSKKEAEESEDVKIDIDADVKNDSDFIKKDSNKVDDLSDLPESIKKKLEQSKTDSKSKKVKRKKKSKVKKHVPFGKAHIKATYNNTLISLTDLDGNVISWASTGMAGFKGPKKSTSYAAQIITRIAAAKAKEYGLEEVAVYVRGIGTGREAAIRTLNSAGINVSTIKDITPIPHNGCRAKGPRRV